MPDHPFRRLLVLHSTPDEVLPTLLAGCPELSVAVARAPAEVVPALAAHRPGVVFSIKHGGFPGPAHRPAVHAESVRWVHVGGSGYEHLGAWDPARVTVTNSAGVLAPFLAERALAALLALGTGLRAHITDQAHTTWAPTRFRSLRGRTAVVVGLGHTGVALARLLRSLGMTVVGVRRTAQPHPDADEVVALADLDAVLPRADVLSLHVRLTPETRGLIGSDQLDRLPRGAIVLNSARGPVLDAAALVHHLHADPSARAWLDVFDVEPLPASDPIWSQPGVLVTPHCADQVDDFPVHFARRFASLWQGTRTGRPLPALVSPGPLSPPLHGRPTAGQAE